MNRGGVFPFLSLIALGAIVGDILAHPAGTAAASNGLIGVLQTSFSAALGGRKVNG